MRGNKIKSDARAKSKRKLDRALGRGFVTQIREHLQSARSLSDYAGFSVVTYLTDIALAALTETGRKRAAASANVSIVPQIKEMAEALSSPKTRRARERTG